MISVKAVATIATIATFAAVSTTMLAASASADAPTWAAVAISKSTHVVAWSAGYQVGTGPDSAVAQRAVQECANHPLHPTDCMWVASAQCVALAWNSDRYQPGMGFTLKEAEDDAQLPPDVPHATHMVSVCSDGTGPRGGSYPN